MGMLDMLFAGARDYGDDWGGLLSGNLTGPSFKNRRRVLDAENAAAYAAGGAEPALPVEETTNPFHRDLDMPQIMGAAKSFYGPMMSGLLSKVGSLGGGGEAAAAEAGPGADPSPYRAGSVLDSMFGGGSGAAFTDEAGFTMPPSTNDPASGEPKIFANGVPLPRPRPVTPNTPASVSQDNGQESAAPLSLAPEAQAARASGTLPASRNPGAPADAGGGFGGMIGNLLRSENAPMLLALGGGFAGAPSFGTGMRRAFSGAVPASMQLAGQQRLQQQQTAVLRALISRGVPIAEAQAAMLDPNVMKATAAKYFETKPLQHVVVKDALGNETPMSYDQNTGKYLDMQGKEVKPDATANAGATGSLLAPGVKFDPNLTGDEYMNQFSKDVQSTAKAWLNGEIMPSGNPRMKSLQTYAKTVAQRYAQDMGIPFSDQTYQERLTHRREMASGKAGVGMQRTALRQGLEHLEGATKQAIDLGNVSLGLAPITEGVNAIRGLTDTQKGKVTAFDNKIQTLAGEVGKFFSSAQGGGVHERQLTRDRFKAITSPKVLADAIDSTLELMEGGLHAREQAQQQLFGGNVDPKLQYVTADDRARIDRIRAMSEQLRKGANPAPSAPAAGKTSTGVQWSIVP